MSTARTFLFSCFVLLSACGGQGPSAPSKSKRALPTTSLAAKTSQKESQSRFQSRINLIFQDSKGHYWVITHQEGLFRYDGRQWTHFTKDKDLPPIRAIQEDEQGHIWLGLADGMLVFDGQSFTEIKPDNESRLITESFTYQPEKFEQRWEAQRGHFWFSAFNKNGVYCFDGKRLKHFLLPVPKDYPDFSETEGYLPDYGWDIYAVYGIYKDREKNIWLGTSGSGLFRYDGKTIAWVNEQEEKGVIRAIYQDEAGTIWFGNNAKGLIRYDGSSFVNFSKARQVLDQGLVGALCVEEDREGRLWWGQFTGGLWRYDPRLDQKGNGLPNLAEPALVQYGLADGLDTNYISTLYKDREGRLLVGTGKGGIFLFEKESFKEMWK